MKLNSQAVLALNTNYWVHLYNDRCCRYRCIITASYRLCPHFLLPFPPHLPLPHSSFAVQFQIHFNMLVHYTGWWGKRDAGDSLLSWCRWQPELCYALQRGDAAWDTAVDGKVTEAPRHQKSTWNGRLQFGDHTNSTEVELRVIQVGFTSFIISQAASSLS